MVSGANARRRASNHVLGRVGVGDARRTSQGRAQMI